MPSAFSAPCTTRKSVARGLRRDTRWIATASPSVSTAPTSVTTTNAGSSAQNSAPGVTSSPGQDAKGAPNQGASRMGWASYSPNGADTAQPTAMPMMGAQMRTTLGPRIASATTTTIVTAAATAPADAETPSGTVDIMSYSIGSTVAAMSMITVPETTGVSSRRNHDSLDASMNWKNDETTIRLAMVAGPPSTMAAMHTAMNAPDVPIISTWPEPMRHTRTACNMVVIPLTTMAANTAHAR